ncbi:MAG: metallophosphoesterase family protein [Acetobacteraceae bacterium]|jgi:diadenosine tetraphosphatase ApaH/serine/threonine PP2A family protein phosphatase
MIDFVTAPATLPPGKRVYAIGDVHGCLDRLAALHERIAEDLVTRPVEHSVLVHLGDYVDRGLDSAQVVDWLSGGAPVPVEQTVNLMGNHEDMMLQALFGTDKEATGIWLANGGADSLLSWEISRKVPPAEWTRLIPAEHQTFLHDLEISFRYGDYLFVHAGIRPLVPLDKQDKQDMLWIREPFLSWKHSHEAVVVHGHTPRHDPEIRFNRIGIDTGAVMGGALTCAVLEEDRIGFMQY